MQAFLCTLLISVHVALAFNGTCEQRPSVSVPAFTHWPFDVSCDHLRDMWQSENGVNDSDSFDCSIIHDGISSDEAAFELSDLNDNNIYEARLVINGVHCINSSVIINLNPFPTETCLKSSERNLHYESNSLGDSVTLDCRPSDDSPLIIPKRAKRGEFKTKWWTKCNSETKYRKNNNGWMNVRPPNATYPDSLDMPRVDFYDATNFTCTVTHNGRTMYIVTYAQCIKQKLSPVTPSLTCTINEHAAPGDMAAFDCTGQTVIGTTKSEDISIEWRKNGVKICENRVFEKNVTSLVDDRFTCMAIDETKNTSLECVPNIDEKPTEEIQHMRKKIDMPFHISDVKDKDFASNYTIIFRVRDSNGIWRNSTEHLTLINNDQSTKITLIVVFGSLMGCLLLVVFASIALYPKRIYFLVWYRNVFKNYDKDDKAYVAYLSYHYDTEVESEQMEATEKIVMAFHSVMEGLGYSFYDEQNSDAFGAKVQYITNLISNSHRMVIVLTQEYLDDKWKKFHAELGFHGLLESQMGLIFVLTPGVKMALKERAKDDKVWEKVLIALRSKSQSVINWKADMSEETLKRHIEYALPKLKRKERLGSLSSDDAEMKKTAIDKTVYHRSISQTTTCTVVPPTDIQL